MPLFLITSVNYILFNTELTLSMCNSIIVNFEWKLIELISRHPICALNWFPYTASTLGICRVTSIYAQRAIMRISCTRKQQVVGNCNFNIVTVKFTELSCVFLLSRKSHARMRDMNIIRREKKEHEKERRKREILFNI